MSTPKFTKLFNETLVPQKLGVPRRNIFEIESKNIDVSEFTKVNFLIGVKHYLKLDGKIKYEIMFLYEEGKEFLYAKEGEIDINDLKVSCKTSTKAGESLTSFILSEQIITPVVRLLLRNELNEKIDVTASIFLT